MFLPDGMVEGYDSRPTMQRSQGPACDGRGGTWGPEVLVTFNIKDSPDASTARFDVKVVHTDGSPLDPLYLHLAPTLRALVELVDAYDSPAMT